MQTQTQTTPIIEHTAPVREAINAALDALRTTYPIILKNAGSSRLWQARNMAQYGHVHPTDQPGIFFVDSAHSTGQQYAVDTQAKSCTCPDAAKGNICKHRIAAWIFRTAQEQLRAQAETLSAEHRAAFPVSAFLSPEVLAAIKSPPPAENQASPTAFPFEMSAAIVEQARPAWESALTNLPAWFPVKPGGPRGAFAEHQAFIERFPGAEVNIPPGIFADYPITALCHYQHPSVGWLRFMVQAAPHVRITPAGIPVVAVVAHHHRPFSHTTFQDPNASVYMLHVIPGAELPA